MIGRECGAGAVAATNDLARSGRRLLDTATSGCREGASPSKGTSVRSPGVVSWATTGPNRDPSRPNAGATIGALFFDGSQADLGTCPEVFGPEHQAALRIPCSWIDRSERNAPVGTRAERTQVPSRSEEDKRTGGLRAKLRLLDRWFNVDEPVPVSWTVSRRLELHRGVLRNTASESLRRHVPPPITLVVSEEVGTLLTGRLTVVSLASTSEQLVATLRALLHVATDMVKLPGDDVAVVAHGVRVTPEPPVLRLAAQRQPCDGPSRQGDCRNSAAAARRHGLPTSAAEDVVVGFTHVHRVPPTATSR